MPKRDEEVILDSTKVALLSPEKWTELTYLSARRRSTEFKKIDAELATSHASLARDTWNLAQAKELHKALMAWKKSKGDAEEWKHSKRNRNRAIELLDIYIDHALTHPNYRYRSEELRVDVRAQDALGLIQDPAVHVRQIAQPMRMVRLKSDAKKEYDESRRKYLETAYERTKRRATDLRKKIDAADERSRELTDGLDVISGLAPGQIGEVIGSVSGNIASARSSVLNPKNVLDAAGSMVDDFTGVIGKKAFASFERSFNMWYQAHLVESARKFVRSGTPDAAVKALEVLLHRTKREYLKKGGIQSVSSLLKTTGLLTGIAAEGATLVATLGIGAPVAVAEAVLGEMLNKAVDRGEKAVIDYFVEGALAKLAEEEVEKANHILQNQLFDENMFIETPIFGVHFLLPGRLPDSAILGWGNPAFGTDVFEEYVRLSKPKMSELRVSALIVENESPIEIVGAEHVRYIDKETLRAGSMTEERLMQEYDQINAEIRLKINEKLIWLDKKQIKELALAAATASSPQTFKPALQVWKQTLITRPNLEIIAEKSGVTQASHYQKKSNFIEQAGLNKDLPYGSLLTTEDWKEFSSVGFFSKQKPRFLFSRRTKETKVLDDAFANFQQDYSNQMIETARVVTNKSATSGEDLPIARRKMDQRWEQLQTLLTQIKVWLEAKQESGTSTRMASVLHLYHLVLIEQRTVASERDRLGDPSHFHSGTSALKAQFDRSKPRGWDRASGPTRDGRGIWLRRET